MNLFEFFSFDKFLTEKVSIGTHYLYLLTTEKNSRVKKFIDMCLNQLIIALISHFYAFFRSSTFFTFRRFSRLDLDNIGTSTYRRISDRLDETKPYTQIPKFQNPFLPVAKTAVYIT